MSPGTMHGFGTIGPDVTPVFGLPGDAVGAQVSFEAFVRPALRRMLGVPQLHRPLVSARAGADMTSPPRDMTGASDLALPTDGGTTASCALPLVLGLVDQESSPSHSRILRIRPSDFDATTCKPLTLSNGLPGQPTAFGWLPPKLMRTSCVDRLASVSARVLRLKPV